MPTPLLPQSEVSKIFQPLADDMAAPSTQVQFSPEPPQVIPGEQSAPKVPIDKSEPPPGPPREFRYRTPDGLEIRLPGRWNPGTGKYERPSEVEANAAYEKWQSGQKEKMESTPHTLGSMAASAIGGLPLGDLAAAPVVAGVKTAVGKIKDPSASISDLYGKNVEETQRFWDVFKKNEPAADIGARLLGGGLGLSALTAKFPSLAWMLGVNADASTKGMITRGGLSSGAISGIDSYVRGELGDPNVPDPATSAVVGGALGAVIPGTAGYLAGRAGQKLGEMNPIKLTPQALKDYSPNAIQLLKGALSHGGYSPAEVEQALSNTGRGGIVLNIPVLDYLARAIRDTPGTIEGIGARKIIEDAVKSQGKKTAGFADKVLDSAFGPQKDMDVLRAGWNAEKQAAGKYFDDFRSMQIPRTSELDQIQSQLAAAGVLPRAKMMAGISGKGFNPSNLNTSDYQTINTALNDKIGKLQREGQNGLARELTLLKHRMIDAIDNHPNKSIGQAWKKGRDMWADPVTAQQSYENGRTFLNPGIHRDDVSEMMRRMSKPEREAFQWGVRTNLDDILDRARLGTDGISQIRQMASKANLEKLAAIPEIGDAGAKRFAKAAEQFSKQAESRVVAAGGSQTSTNQGMREMVATPKSALESAANLYNPEVTALRYVIPPPFVNALNQDLAKTWGADREDVARILAMPAKEGKIVLNALANWKPPGEGMSEKMRYLAFLSAMSEISRQYPGVANYLSPYANKYVPGK